MDRKLRNRILLYLVLAGGLAYVLVELSGRKPVPKVSVVEPTRENLVSSISSNGKVEPIAPYVMRAQLDTFVEKVRATEGQPVKKGQVILELDVKDAAARLAEAKAKLLKAEDDLRSANAGGKIDEAARVAGDLAKAEARRDRLQKNNDVLQRLPNINVNVRINSRERLGVLSVPRGAVEADGGRRYVFVVKKNQLGVGKSTLEKREIHVGIADATNYEVVSGLQEGELVALPGDVDLRDGMTVIVVSTEAVVFEGWWNA